MANRSDVPPPPVVVRLPVQEEPPVAAQVLVDPLPVVNQSVTLSVGALTVQASSVSLVVEKLDQKVEVREPQVHLQLTPTIDLRPSITVEAAQLTVPQQSAPTITVTPVMPAPVINLPEMRPTIEVNVPSQEPAVVQDVCPPLAKRKIKFTRDGDGNIVSAEEV